MITELKCIQIFIKKKMEVVKKTEQIKKDQGNKIIYNNTFLAVESVIDKKVIDNANKIKYNNTFLSEK